MEKPWKESEEYTSYDEDLFQDFLSQCVFRVSDIY